MNTRLIIPVATVFLVTFLARSVSSTSSRPVTEGPAKARQTQEFSCFHYYESKTNTPWILLQKMPASADTPAPYFGGFKKVSGVRAPVQTLQVICPHNPQRCATYYVAQAKGFTWPRNYLKDTGYEWVNVRDITSSKSSDHGVWARTRNGNKVLICPMLVKALKKSTKQA